MSTQFNVSQWKPSQNHSSKPKRKDFTEVNSNPATGVSLCIPFAYKNTGAKKVFAVFQNLKIMDQGTQIITNFGLIERIDIKSRQDGNKCIFIHFKANKWNDTEENRHILENMKAGHKLKVINDEKGHFWKTIISKSQRPADYFEDSVEEKTAEDSGEEKTPEDSGEEKTPENEYYERGELMEEVLRNKSYKLNDNQEREELN